MKDFSVFPDVRRYKNWVHKIDSWKILTIRRLVLPVLPEHRVPHFCSPPWTPFRGCWRSAAAAAHDLILVELDSKHPWQVPICNWDICYRVRTRSTPCTRDQLTERRCVEAKNGTLFWKLADGEGGTLVLQKNHLIWVWMPHSFLEQRWGMLRK